MPEADAFLKALDEAAPPSSWSAALRSLWHAARGDWDIAHEIVQAEEADPDAAWVHAHLHRIEGDLDNARYWYGRARRPYTSAPLEEERAAIAMKLLGE